MRVFNQCETKLFKSNLSYFDIDDSLKSIQILSIAYLLSIENANQWSNIEEINKNYLMSNIPKHYEILQKKWAFHLECLESTWV